ncbi:MAG: terminase small subunit, Nu1 [Alphaproteobacteria bacterium]|nr:terminase small subunit, Nu1 [Alphaproteobacteria bacterium]
MAAATQSLAVIAKLLDLSERRVQQLSREGVIPKATRGQYDLIGSVRGYVRYLRDQAVSAQAGAPDYAAERARYIRARADLVEMEASQRRGALIAADDIETAWIKVLALLHTRVLSLPDRLAPQIHAEGSLAETRNLLSVNLREALEDLANSDVQPDIEDSGLAGPAPNGETGTGKPAATTGVDDQ